MHKIVVRVILAAVAGLFILNLIASLQWRIQHDSSILLYITWMMDHFGSVPYRDIFDINLPGTYLFYFLIGKISGYTDLGVRLVDIVLLAAILFMSFQWMKKFGWKIALCGSVLWGLTYLSLGPSSSLQREYLILLAVLGSILIADSERQKRTLLKSFAIGLLFGIAFLLKPPAILAFPFVVFFQFRNAGKMRFLRHAIMPAIVGFVVPASSALLYLYARGGLAQFFDMVWNYLPLYVHLTGNHEALSGLAWIKYLSWETLLLGGFLIWLIPAAIGVYVALRKSAISESQRRRVKLLIVLAICYAVYPTISGQFWDYHYLIFFYFAGQLSALCILGIVPRTGQNENLRPAVIFLIFILFWFRPNEEVLGAIMGRGVSPVKSGRVDAIASFLVQHLQPDDTVQPLDWTGGAVNAMLIAKARLATPFPYDFYFYHDTSNSYIRGLRKKFITDLLRSRPRFIIQITDRDKPWVFGENTTDEFRQLQSILDTSYRAVAGGNGYLLYQKNNDR